MGHRQVDGNKERERDRVDSSKRISSMSDISKVRRAELYVNTPRFILLLDATSTDALTTRTSRSSSVHCWNYRSFITKRLALSLDDDVAFTKEKISENFSNYSALHHRMKLFRKRTFASAKDVGDALFREIEMVCDAVYTEPDDQSSWLYARWMFEWALDMHESFETEETGRINMFETKGPMLASYRMIVNACKELVAVEGDLKWPMLTEYFLLELTCLKKELRGRCDEETTRMTHLLDRLKTVDPMHATYYADAQRVVKTWRSRRSE